MTLMTCTTSPRSVTPITNEKIEASESSCYIYKLPTEVFLYIFRHCDLKGFKALSVTDAYSNIALRTLVNGVALTLLCPGLRILDAKTCKFQADLKCIDKYKALLRYHERENFVEDCEGLTIIFNQGGLTLKDVRENKCRITVNGSTIPEEWDNLPEEDTGPEMVSNAPIIGTRYTKVAAQEKCVRECGFDGKPTLLEYIALIIATKKELGISVYPQMALGFGRNSTCVLDIPVFVEYFNPGWIRLSTNRDDEVSAAGGRLNLKPFLLDEPSKPTS